MVAITKHTIRIECPFCDKTTYMPTTIAEWTAGEEADEVENNFYCICCGKRFFVTAQVMIGDILLVTEDEEKVSF